MSKAVNIKHCALTGLKGLMTTRERFSGGANLKLSGANDVVASPRACVTCLASVRLLLLRFVDLAGGGGLEVAVVTGTDADPRLLPVRLAGAATQDSRIA